MSTVANRRDGAIRTRNKPDTLTPPFQPIDEKGQAGGYASLDPVAALVPVTELGTGTPDATTALFGDRTFKAAATAAALATEAAARVAADGTLTTNLTNEATLRANADSAEATARSNADTSEATTRSTADATITANLANEAILRAGADSAEATARTNADALLLVKSANLSDVANAGTSRTNLGLGTAAVKDVPSSGDATSGQVVKGDDSRLADARTPSATKGSTSTPNNTFTTLFAVPLHGRVLVGWTLPGFGGGNDYSGVAEIIADDTVAYLMTSTVGGSTACQISGGNFQAKQMSGGTANIVWTYIYLEMPTS